MSEILIGVSRAAITGFYYRFLRERIKFWWDHRKILKKLIERIEELCDERVGRELSEVLKEVGMPEDFIKKRLKEEKKKKKEYNSITLWMEHIAHLKAFIINLFRLYEIELEQLYHRKLTDKAKKLLIIDIPNQVEDVLLELKPNKLIIQIFKKVSDIENKLNRAIETVSTQENYEQLEILFDQELKKLYEAINTISDSQGTALLEIQNLKLQLQTFRASELHKNIFEIKTLFSEGLNHIYTILTEISESPETKLEQVLDILSSHSQGLSNIIDELKKHSDKLTLINERLTGIEQIVSTSGPIRKKSALHRQIIYNTCEQCDEKFANDFITVLRNEGQYICPKCGAIFPGLTIFLSGTSKEKYIYEYVNEKLRNNGYKISWYLDEFRARSNNVLDDCFQNLSRTDRVILVIGRDYGSEYKDSGHSITEEEWKQALEQNKRMLIFVKADVYEEYKRLDKISEPEYDLRIHKFIQTTEEKRKNWVFKFERSADIVNKILVSWGCFLKEKEGSFLESEPKELPISNYDEIMMTTIKEPKYFRMLETAFLGGVFNVDIEQEKVIRIPKLLEDLKEKLFAHKRWVLLSGNSGSSKTTCAKIIAHDARKEGLSIMFCNNINQISKFTETVINSNNEWLLIIDDLHRTEHGKISEKLVLLNSIALKKNSQIQVLCTSRLPLYQIKKDCKKEMTALYVAELFEEIQIGKYKKQINQAKTLLIENNLYSANVPKADFNQIKRILLEHYSSNFVLLGFALLPLLEGKTKKISHRIIFSRIRDLLYDEFENLLQKEIVDKEKLKIRTLLRVFVGTAYRTIFDLSTSIGDFDHSEDSRLDIRRVFKFLRNQGLVLEFENLIVSEGEQEELIYTYRLPHSKIAEMYFSTLKIAMKELEIGNQIYNLKELCTVSRIKKPPYIRLNAKKFKELCTYFTRLDELDLSNYESFGIFGRIHNNQLIEIPSTIGYLKKLKILDLSYNSLTNLPMSISNLKSLEYLNLCGNPLKNLPSSICNLSSLKSLNLQSTPLIKLPNSIGNLKKLQRLYLGGVCINNFPKSMENLTSLEYLDLRYSGLKRLPESISFLKNLKFLDLEGNKFIDLPEEIGKLTSLRKLNLRSSFERVRTGDPNFLRNKRFALPESLGNLKKLEELIVRDTEIMYLPESIGDLESLQTLFIPENWLTELPNSIGNLNSLEILNLNTNHLKFLPGSIGNLRSLRELRISNNYELQKLPDMIGNLKSLELLTLSNNSLSELPNTFGALDSLEHLELRENPLKFLPDAICELQSLKKLDLTYTNLEELPEKFGNIKSLEKLDLSVNDLRDLPQSFKNLNKLKKLNLRANKLEKVPDAIKELPSLRVLDLSENNIIDKESREVIRELRLKGIIVL